MRVKSTIMSAAVVLAAAWGCGNGAPSVSSSREEANVKGTVTVKGKPFDDGEVFFDPTNIHRKDAMARSSKVKKGNYELKTLVGENSVTVQGPKIDNDPDRATNHRVIIVQPGDNTIAIDIP